jgi:hypothetical protein
VALILVGIMVGLLLQRVLRPEVPQGAARAGIPGESIEPAADVEPIEARSDGLEMGISLEDPLASLAFLSNRVEETRAAARSDARRAEETRRRVARFDYGAPPPDAPQGYTNLELGLHTEGDQVPDARVSASALSPSRGVRAPYGGPTDDARASTSPSPEVAQTTRAGRRVPRPPSRTYRGGVGNGAVPSASTGGSVTIGEPMQDLPPSTAMLARAAAAARGASAPTTPTKRPLPRAVPPPPPPTDDEYGYEEEQEALIGPERAPALEPAALIARGAVLLRPGRLRISPSMTYTYSDRARITTNGLDVLGVLFIGEIFEADVRSSQLTSTLSLRYGLSERLNIRATIPYEYRKTEVHPQNLENQALPIRRASKQTDNAMGDITLGASYQLYRSDSRLPSIVGNFSYSMDTGDPPAIGRGTDRISTGLTFVTQSDPASLFASVSYIHSLDDFEGFQRGDMLGGSIGFSYALNYDLSTSMSFNFLREIENSKLKGGSDEVNRRLERRTTISSLGFGITYGLTNRMAIDVNIGAGLTDDAPELSLFIGLPMVFDTSGWW